MAMIKRIILSGFGNVGREFVRLVRDKGDYIEKRYKVSLVLCGVAASRGMIFENDGINLDLLLRCQKGSDGIEEYAKIKGIQVHSENVYKGDVLVEASPTNIEYGEPGLSIILAGISHGMDIVSVSKGALVTIFGKVFAKAREMGVRIKYSGATAAALPTIDIGDYSLAGTSINAIEGILNGTTNYILTKMYQENISFEKALEDAVKKGIAEKNSYLDISGTDSACKILLLSNSLLGTEFSLSDVDITGIGNISSQDIEKARGNNETIKLIARAYNTGRSVKLEVKPRAIPLNHFFANVSGTNKAVIFSTDSMGEVMASGGASDPEGAAAAAIKDIINLYR